MAQTTGQTTFVNPKIEISTNGTSWTDISGFTSKIEVSGGERVTGERYTADGENALVGVGKKKQTEVTCAIVYTEGAADPYEVVRNAYDTTGTLYLRWSPKGGSNGQFRFTTGAGYVYTPVYPTGDVSSGDPILIEFKLSTGGITKSVVS